MASGKAMEIITIDDDSDMDVGSDSEERTTEKDTTNGPKGNEVDIGVDFIGFEESDIELEGGGYRHQKRKRPLDEDHDRDDKRTGPPIDCPWMGHRNYTKLASVPAMLTQELLDFVDYISPTTEEHQVREYVVNLVQRTINGLWPDVEVVVFGSFETRLYLPTR